MESCPYKVNQSLERSVEVCGGGVCILFVFCALATLKSLILWLSHYTMFLCVELPSFCAISLSVGLWSAMSHCPSRFRSYCLQPCFYVPWEVQFSPQGVFGASHSKFFPQLTITFVSRSMVVFLFSVTHRIGICFVVFLWIFSKRLHICSWNCWQFGEVKRL